MKKAAFIVHIINTFLEEHLCFIAFLWQQKFYLNDFLRSRKIIQFASCPAETLSK